MLEAKAAGAQTAAVTEPVSEGKTAWDIILVSAGKRKMEVVAVIREATGLDLAAAKAIVDGTPKNVLTGAKKPTADSVKAQLEAIGASVELK